MGLLAQQTESPEHDGRPIVVLVGPYPPPPGGIANHVHRLHEVIGESYHAHALDLYGDTPMIPEPEGVRRCGRKPPFNLIRAMRLLRKARADLVHLHVGNMHRFSLAGYALLAVLPSTTRTVITIHGGGFAQEATERHAIRWPLIARLIKRMDHIIVVNDQQMAVLNQIGIEPRQTSKIPAFLAPRAEPDAAIEQEILRLRADGRHILLVSGVAVPAYGFHVVLEAVQLLGPTAEVSVVFAFYRASDAGYVSKIEEQLAATCPGHIFRDLDPGSFAYLIQLVDILVRPTDRDGDAVVVREALHYQKRVVASDAVERPAGVRLFQTMEPKSLAESLDAEMRSHTTGVATKEDFGAAVMGVYGQLVGPS